MDGLAKRILELQEREFESPESRDVAVDVLLNEVERQFFLGSLKKLKKREIDGLSKRLAGSLAPELDPLKAIKEAMALVN